jgi:transcriptional regulator with XRE-family HTH domain
VNEIAPASSAESLCVRLRRERERRHIALSSISANTKISATLFESLERGDVSRWPSGIYRRSFIRAYANAIGLDADAIAREFVEQFPDPLEPPPAVEPPASTSPIVPPAPGTAAAAKPAAVHVLRLRLADTGRPFAPGRLLTNMRQRAIAAACDGGVVLAMALCGFIVFEKFWLPLGVAMLAYYLGGILVLGNTPGVCLLAIDHPDAPAPYNQPADEPDPSPARGATSAPWHFRMPAR